MFVGEKCIRCNKHFKFDDLIYRSNGFGMCRECDAKVDPTKEPVRQCPQDRQTMNKELVYDRVLIDKCPTCGGVWFDGDEIEIVRNLVQREGLNSPVNLIPYLVLPLATIP